MKQKQHILSEKQLERYAVYLRQQERAESTVRKYLHDLRDLEQYADGKPLTRERVLAWKEELQRDKRASTVNSMLAAANGFFTFMGWQELCLRFLKVQKALFREESRELTRGEYFSLVREAQKEGNYKLSLAMQTICATGIRVSELQYITVEVVAAGRAVIRNKGKLRTVFLPEPLRKLLQNYLRTQKITAGAVFVTKSGKPLDRANIWRSMKLLCEKAEVPSEKVFPHNLRHLFARTYYTAEKDLVRLADLLGHSNVNTTRIYTAESNTDYAKRMEKLDLIAT